MLVRVLKFVCFEMGTLLVRVLCWAASTCVVWG